MLKTQKPLLVQSPESSGLALLVVRVRRRGDDSPSERFSRAIR
jgi:hypothetical protein